MKKIILVIIVLNLSISSSSLSLTEDYVVESFNTNNLFVNKNYVKEKGL